MKFLAGCFFFAVALIVSGCVQEAEPPRTATSGEPYPLAGKQFGNGAERLYVLLHGDISRGGPADYLYAFGLDIVQKDPDATVFALLRPGYEDRDGQISTGSNNQRRDHYTATNNDLVAATIRNLSEARPEAEVIALGHSGGAAQLGTINGRYPGLVDTSYLLSCPCDIDKWRASRGRSSWPRSQSPIDHVETIAPGAKVVLVVGGKDKNTTPALSRDYLSALRRAGIDGKLIVVPDAGHGFNKLGREVLGLIQ